jgi:hypothetical protein
MDKLNSELRDIVKKINQLWVGGNAEELSEFFHEDMVIVGPDLKMMGAGREDCVRGYIDFGNQARVLKYVESDFKINVWGNTARVDYGFEITYEMSGQKCHDTGRDLFIFSKDDNEGKWLAVWRMLVPSPKMQSKK